MHMNKRILSLTLALVMILGTFTAVFAAEATAQEKAGKFLEEVGLLKGDEHGDLLLGEKLERRDSVVLLARLLGEEDLAAKFETDEKNPSWTDVRSDDYYVPFFAWAEAREYFEGKDNGKFEPRASLTTQEYAVVLLRALGHKVNGAEAWKTVMETAKKEGLMENVDSKANEALLRGDMAVMTLNALKATVKGTGNTLAEELNIKLPVPAKLAVEDVYADNLKEVKVKFNKDVEKALENADFYTLNRNKKVESARIEGDLLILEVSPMLDNKKDHTLTIKGTNLVDGKHDFVAYDNEVPYVKNVEALGTKAIKVTVSEPIVKDEVKSRTFKLDGKSFYGKVTFNDIGNEIFLTPYGSKLAIGDHELVVGVLKDHAKFVSVEEKFDFVVEEDTVAPEIVEVTGTLEKVVVEFSEDVDPDTVKETTLFWNKKANNAKKVNRLSGNKYEFELKNRLPLYEITLNVQGVKDYSGNEMKAVEMPFKGQVDETRPEVIRTELNEDGNVITVEFSKAVGTVKESNFTIKNDKSEVEKNIISGITSKSDNKVVTVNLYRSLKADKEYSILIDGVKDTTTFENTMVPYEGIIERTSKVSAGKVTSAVKSKDNKEIIVYFSKEMNVETLVDMDNYLIGGKLLSAIEDAEIEPHNGNKAVRISLPKANNATAIYVLSVRDLDNKLISNYNTEIPFANNVSGYTVKATGLKELTLEFKTEILDASASAFTVKVDSVENEVNSVDVNGKKVVLKLSDNLPANAEGIKVKVDPEKIDSELVVISDAIVDTVEDKIAPTIKKVEVATDAAINITTTTTTTTEGIKIEVSDVTSEVAIKLIMTEDVKSHNANDLVITNNNTGKVLDPVTDYEVTSTTGKAIEINIKNFEQDEKTVKESVSYTINISENARSLRDMKDNIATPKKDAVKLSIPVKVEGNVVTISGDTTDVKVTVSEGTHIEEDIVVTSLGEHKIVTKNPKTSFVLTVKKATAGTN